MKAGLARRLPPDDTGAFRHILAVIARGVPAALAAALISLVAVVGCSPAREEAGGPGARLRVLDARIPAPPPGAPTAAVYLRIVNDAAEDDHLLSVACDAAQHAHLHETVHEGDMARMLPRPEGYAVPAGGTLELAPGGRHIMLMGLDSEPAAGDTVALRLHFEKAGAIDLEVPVVGGGAESGEARDGS